jgi:predicted DNA-binding transcriptional regulator YafY
VSLPSAARLPVIGSALRTRSRLAFRYPGVDRAVAPYGLLCRDGFWYVAGDDRTRPGRKNFRVDRVEGDIAVGAADAFDRPADFSLEDALPDEPYELAGDEPVEVDVWLDRVMALRHVDDVVSRGDDGSVVVRLRVSNGPGFRSWLFGMRDHARVVAPQSVVDDITSWLRTMAAR